MPKFRSNFERTLALDLKRSGVTFGYETQRIDYQKSHFYTPDFVIGNGVLIEAKGRFLSSDRGKHLLIQKQHPELDIRFVFMNARNKLNKRSRTTYADWCDRHGFLWSEMKIPTEWLT
jgi:hypothetical protein